VSVLQTDSLAEELELERELKELEDEEAAEIETL